MMMAINPTIAFADSLRRLALALETEARNMRRTADGMAPPPMVEPDLDDMLIDEEQLRLDDEAAGRLDLDLPCNQDN